ncbi:MAG: cell division protein SepF [Firmicutes bacterium]|jgi:cell division inhibitor SepF|nr:cell division protein SepF [Bacillota bacterium]
MASVFDKILGFLGVQDEYDEEEEQRVDVPSIERVETTFTPARANRPRRMAEKEEIQPRKANLVSLAGGQRVQTKMLILEPLAFDDVRSYVMHLKGKRALIVRLHRMDRGEAQRVVDFMSGATHALEGNMRKLGERIFCFAPATVEIEGDAAADFYDLDSE